MRNATLWIILTFLLSPCLAPAAGDETDVEAVETEIPHHGELRMAERKPPWLGRWRRMMDARVDDLGRTSAEALRQAREYVATMPWGAGPESGGGTDASSQSVPGDAWQNVGPAPTSGPRTPVTGRIRGVAVVDENLLYIGAAGGGVWKYERDPIEQTETWTPLSDFEETLAIGALVIDHQDPQILYAGTGEVGNGISSYYGAGVLKTTDGGADWDLKGKPEFDKSTDGARINTIALDPTIVPDPEIERVLYVAASNGLWRATKGGESWNRIRTGHFSDVVIDPTNSDRLFAAQHGVGIWKYTPSTGAMQLLSDVGGQLPVQRFGRIRLAMVPDPLGGFPILFASYRDTAYGQDLKGIWKSNDFGVNWTRVTGHPRQFADGLFANANLVETEPNDGTGTADNVPVNQTVQGTISSASEVDWYRFTLTGNNAFNAEIVADRAGTGLHPRLSLYDGSGNPFMRDGVPYVKNGKNSGIRHPAGGTSQDARMLTSDDIPPGTYYIRVSSEDGTTGAYQLSILGIELRCQCDYDQALMVDPGDPDVIYMGLVKMYRSLDGGTNWTNVQDHGGSNWIHVDIQTIVQHPTDANTIFVGNDGGLWKSVDRGDTWTTLNTDGLSITQPYRASLHPTDPGFMLIGNQDNASAKLEAGAWTEVWSGDGGSNAIVSNTEYYYSSQNGDIWKHDSGAGHKEKTQGLDFPGSAFVTEFVMDPNNSQVLLTSGGEMEQNGTVRYRVYRTTTGANLWFKNSQDLGNRVIALAIAPSNGNTYYAGTDRGNVWRTTNAGATDWTEISWPNHPTRRIGAIAVAGNDPDRVYVAYAGFGNGHVFRSTDGGTTWEDISRAPHGNPAFPPGISQTPLPDLPIEAIVVDPSFPDTIFVGTDLGVFRTLDGGLNWHKFGYRLPNAGVRDLVLSTTSGGTGKLIAATHGRGVWELVVSNDECANAQVITDGTFAGTTRGATAEGDANCGGTISTPAVWYQYTATCDGELRARTCNANFDTVVSIHDNACPGTALNQLDCNDDCADGSCGSGASCAVTQVTQGSTYLMRVSGWGGASGDFELDVDCEIPHDTCDNAASLDDLNYLDNSSTRGGAWDNAPVCNTFDNTSAGVWYTVEGTGNTMTVSTCSGASYDTKLSVYCSGCNLQKCITANDDACGGLQSEASWCAAPGTTYHVLVHGFQAQEGTFELQVSDDGINCGPFYTACNPHNDNCTQAQPLDVFGSGGDNTDASTTAAPSCRSVSGDVWYDFKPICHGFAQIDTCDSAGSLADTVLAVYDSCGGGELACNDDACGFYSQVNLPMTPGESMKVMVADYFGNGVADEGSFNVDVDTNLTGVVTPWPDLYMGDGANSLEDRLLRLDPEETGFTDVGPLGIVGLSGMTYVPGLGLMYGLNDGIDVDEIVTIDLDTGAASPFASPGYASLRGIAYDPSARMLYAVDSSLDVLVAIDPFTGIGTTVGGLGFGQVEGLAYNVNDGKLYGSDVVTDQLIEISTLTGAGTAIGPFGGGFGEIRGLAWDTRRNVLYGSDVSGTSGSIVTIDPTTGAATSIEAASSYSDMQPEALGWVEGLPPATAGLPYEAQLPISGGCPGYFLSNATGLPPGLSIDGNGKVSGIPTQAGKFTMTYDLGDSDIGTPSISASYPIVVRPGNDECPLATIVGDGSHAFSNVRASTDGPDEPTACNFSGYSQVGADIWYVYEATCSGTLTASVCGSGFDTKVALYEGTGCPSVESADGCNDDFCGLQSEATMAVSAGELVLVRVGGYRSAQGSGTLNLSCSGTPAGGCCTGVSCSLQTAADCAANSGTYLGDGSDCTVDVDADGLPDGCDGCPADSNKLDPGLCGCGAPDIDQDGDGWCEATDCDDLDESAYGIPGEVTALVFINSTTLSWDVPAETGGTGIRYDTLRSDAANDFTGVGTTCVESDDTDTTAGDPATPLAGQVFHYLIRAGTNCGEGPLGDDSGGAPRSGVACP